MAAGVVADYSGQRWVFTYTAAAAAGFTLPYTIWPKDLIPTRIDWVCDSAAVAGNRCVIQETGNGTTPDVYAEVAQGAYYRAPPQLARRAEKWQGPIILSTFDNGILMITP